MWTGFDQVPRRNVAETQYRIGALERALEIVAAIGDAGEIPLGQLAARLQIPKGSLLRHLRVLEHAGYVTRAPQAKVYSLGPALIHLGFVARQRLRVSEVAAPAMRWLRDRYNESVHVGILSVPMSCMSASRRVGRPSRWRFPWGSARSLTSALGKALLAWAPPSTLEAIVSERGLPQLTARSITDVARLRREFEKIRARGWAIDDEESADGLRCVAAPVRDERDDVIAAISVSAPTSRLSRSKAREISPGQRARRQPRIDTARLGGDAEGAGWAAAAPWG